MKTSLLLLSMLMYLLSVGNPDTTSKKEVRKLEKIIVELEFSEGIKKEKIQLTTIPADYAAWPDRTTWKPEINGNIAKWTLTTDRPLIGNMSLIFGGGHIFHLYELGDSIHIDITGVKTIYSGKGSEKLRLVRQLKEEKNLIANRIITGFDMRKFHPDYYEINTLNDFLEWNNCLNLQERVMDSLFESYKRQITPYAFEFLKAEVVSNMESVRLFKFGMLAMKASQLGVPGEKLVEIFDESSQNKYVRWLHTYTGKVGNTHYFYDFARRTVQRKYNFNLKHDSLKVAERKIAYANVARKTYKGLMLQDCLVYLLTDQGIKEHGNTPTIELLLTEFYTMPGYPEHKAYVKEYEQLYREWAITAGNNAPDFSLQDQEGRLFSKMELKGKLVIMNFIDDSRESIGLVTALKKVQQEFDRNTDVVFLNVSTQKDKAHWTNDLSNPDYTIKNAINLYTNGEGKDHLALKYYNLKDYPEFQVTAYPKAFLLNSRGRFVYSGDVSKGTFGMRLELNPADKIFPDPRKDNGRALIRGIYEQLAIMKDGPYVFYDKDELITTSIHSLKVSTQKHNNKRSVRLITQTDDWRETLTIKLKSTLQKESSEYPRPEKLFVLSDIEGNFEAFRKLLQSNKIIDKDFNWTFGNGHLVFAGDMFDRGQQVTECLWLIYSLEEKAKASGGYVHFVLGNHEIMNLQGDDRYVEGKYKDNILLLGKSLVELYNTDSELGRWLRTKNIVEKVGDLLFMHGGFSAELNAQPLTIEEINNIARPFYDNNKAAKNEHPQVSLLYNSMTSPFWHRLYYRESPGRGIYKAKEGQVDSTLQKFSVKHIITGHSVIADTISVHFNNKVINTDTRHARGKSEALLIEADHFYRVNATGGKVLLFIDDKKKQK